MNFPFGDTTSTPSYAHLNKVERSAMLLHYLEHVLCHGDEYKWFTEDSVCISPSYSPIIIDILVQWEEVCGLEQGTQLTMRLSNEEGERKYIVAIEEMVNEDLEEREFKLSEDLVMEMCHAFTGVATYNAWEEYVWYE